jgi:hypothetical protein
MEEGWLLGMGFGTLTKGWVEKEPEKVGSNNLPNNEIQDLGRRIRTTRLLRGNFLMRRSVSRACSRYAFVPALKITNTNSAPEAMASILSKRRSGCLIVT